MLVYTLPDKTGTEIQTHTQTHLRTHTHTHRKTRLWDQFQFSVREQISRQPFISSASHSSSTLPSSLYGSLSLSCCLGFRLLPSSLYCSFCLFSVRLSIFLLIASTRVSWLFCVPPSVPQFPRFSPPQLSPSFIATNPRHTHTHTHLIKLS